MQDPSLLVCFEGGSCGVMVVCAPMKVVGRLPSFLVIETVLGVSTPFQQHPNRENEETFVERRVESRSLLCSSVRSELWRDWFSGV